MKISKGMIFGSIFFALFLSLAKASIEKADNWQKWLDEVNLIMTKAEKSVFQSLQTEEDRQRFQKLFWQMRDPTPQTPQNEFMIEYYSRLQYAEKNLDGARSDRGQIYILLGKPLERTSFSGYEKVVDCELWYYRSEGRPGLPSDMNLLFYRPNDFGNYKLFYPGLHTALEIISPNYFSSISKNQAFNEIRSGFPELARATLSIVPGESSAISDLPGGSSGSTLAQIFTLPEREVKKSYLSSFKSIEGVVDVTYSTKEIGGKGSLFLSENRGFRFLNYALMPDVIQTTKIADNFHAAKIGITLRIENLEGKTIFQEEREINLKMDDAQKKEMLENKIVFKDFVPLVEGEFNVSITFSNKTTDEFFVYKEKINITPTSLPIVAGYEIREVGSDYFVPFSIGHYKVLSDPRSLFDHNDTLQGIISSDQKNQVYLTDLEKETEQIEIHDIRREGNFLVFRQLLQDIKPGNYTLSIKNEKGEVYKKIISILSFEINKPIEFERSEPSSSESNYIFLIAQEYLNKGEVERALEYFHKLPENLWNEKTIPIIAQAYYQKKDYGKVVELLERNAVEKNYSVLLLLGNSSLELKSLGKAAQYFEMLRKYGDTVKINQTLGAIYYSLGDKEKAKIYWERAKKLEEKSNKINFDKMER